MKTLLFDLDETLVNSTALHIDAFRETFLKYGVRREKLPKRMLKDFIGKRLFDINRMVIDYFKLNVAPKDIDRERNRIVLTKIKKMQKLMPGAKKALLLGKKLGFKIAICSSGVPDYILGTLKKFRLEKLFDSIVSGNDVKRGKPSPECYLLAAKKLKMKPEHCIVFEDAENGVIAGKKAGMKVIAVENPHTPKQDLSKADIILDSLEELKQEMLL